MSNATKTPNCVWAQVEPCCGGFSYITGCRKGTTSSVVEDGDKCLFCGRPIVIRPLATTHLLKTWPHYFVALEAGRKRFEYRLNDRGFKVGDKLLLQEWLPSTEQYTGRELFVKVDYILPLEDNHVIMSISPEGDELPSEAFSAGVRAVIAWLHASGSPIAGRDAFEEFKRHFPDFPTPEE